MQLSGYDNHDVRSSTLYPEGRLVRAWLNLFAPPNDVQFREQQEDWGTIETFPIPKFADSEQVSSSQFHNITSFPPPTRFKRRILEGYLELALTTTPFLEIETAIHDPEHVVHACNTLSSLIQCAEHRDSNMNPVESELDFVPLSRRSYDPTQPPTRFERRPRAPIS